MPEPDSVACAATHPLGMRCTRGLGHGGEHRNGELAWEPRPLVFGDRTLLELLEGRRTGAGGEP